MTWIVVLADGAGFLDEILDLPELTHSNTSEVHDGAAGVNHSVVIAHGRADGQPLPQELFIFDNKTLNLAFGRCHRKELGEVQFAQLFDVYRSAILSTPVNISDSKPHSKSPCWWPRTLSIL